ncbi:MAG: DUF3887 domain-containing protein [Cyanobacteriota bacterium]|nr:DUF3887 domain-containing protein [Cyanobacteriota bacterium]
MLPRALASAVALMAIALPIALPLARPDPALAQPGPTAAAGANQPALSVEQARAAVNNILAAERRRDAQARFRQFSPELQAVTSPAMIAETMARRPAIRGWTLLSIQSGIQTTTVEASVDTAGGKQSVFILLNPEAQITGYYTDRTDEAPSKVAEQFVKALSSGHYITARSFLTPSLQREVSTEQLQARWQGLQRETGNFLKVNRVIEAGSNAEQTLVLVNTTFNRLTDNLFVVLDANHLIFNVDFPHEVDRLRGQN